MERLNTSDLSGEERYEAEAAFGEDADLVRLEPDDLEPVETPDFLLKNVLEEGDWVTIGHTNGELNTTVGPVEDVDTVGFTMDPRNRTTSGHFGYGDFEVEGTDERGIVNRLIDINGRPAGRVISERMEADD